jgi:hypothetical protein
MKNSIFFFVLFLVAIKCQKELKIGSENELFAEKIKPGETIMYYIKNSIQANTKFEVKISYPSIVNI